MDLSEVALLIGKAALIDGRGEPTEAEARAWYELLEEYPYEQARLALLDHFRESDRRLMPAHLIDRMNEAADQARMAGRPWPPPEPPGALPRGRVLRGLPG
jgi:hypothetical protein